MHATCNSVIELLVFFFSFHTYIHFNSLQIYYKLATETTTESVCDSRDGLQDHLTP